MIFSRDRILTTHVGSLPRNEKLSDLLVRQEAGEASTPSEMAAEMDKAVRHVVDKQAAAGIDIGNDGEQQRVGFQTYVPQRMSGFGGVSKRRRGREFEEFPELVASLMRRFPHVSKQQNAPEAQTELKYLDIKPLESEIARFKKIAEGKFAEQFMTAPSPGIISTTMLNAHYDIARRLSRCARARDAQRISGDPQSRADPADRRARSRHGPHHDVPRPVGRRFRQARRDATSRRSTPASTAFRASACGCMSATATGKARTSTTSPLATILPALYQAKVGALSIEFSNPRHAHEYAALKKHPLPKDMMLIPGVIETTSNFVEHPEVVARRIEEAVRGGRRPRARDRLDRLRLRHLHQPGMGDRAGGLAQAALDPRGRRHRLGAAVGQEGGVTVIRRDDRRRSLG